MQTNRPVAVLLFPGRFPSCRVAGMTVDLSSSHRPVHSTFQVSLASVFHLVFGRPLFLLTGVSVLNSFLSNVFFIYPHHISDGRTSKVVSP